MTDTNIPINQRFPTLDAYLAHLEQFEGPIDGPWYKEVSPGVYRLQTGNLRILGADGDETPRDQTFTRAQLMERFGFKK